VPENITTYIPDNAVRKGYRTLFMDMADEVKSSRWLVWQLFLGDFKAIYKQSIFGILWILFVPLLTLGTFILLNNAGIFKAGNIPLPYPLFALLGMAFWQLFSTGLTATTNSLVSAGTMIRKINFPREALVVASMGQAVVAFLIQIVAVVVLFMAYRVTPFWTTLLVPLTLIPILLLTLGIGFILSLANGVARDIGRGTPVILTFLMLATPILYSTPKGGILGTLTRYNPLYHLVTVPRDLIIVGRIDSPYGYSLSVLLSVILFFACWIVFHLTEKRIAERI